MLSNGRPQLSQPAQLRELVDPPSALLAKVALNAANVAGSVSLPTLPFTFERMYTDERRNMKL